MVEKKVDDIISSASVIGEHVHKQQGAGRGRLLPTWAGSEATMTLNDISIKLS
jgi:hypothetical protein